MPVKQSGNLPDGVPLVRGYIPSPVPNVEAIDAWKWHSKAHYEEHVHGANPRKSSSADVARGMTKSFTASHPVPTDPTSNPLQRPTNPTDVMQHADKLLVALEKFTTEHQVESTMASAQTDSSGGRERVQPGASDTDDRGLGPRSPVRIHDNSQESAAETAEAEASQNEFKLVPNDVKAPEKPDEQSPDTAVEPHSQEEEHDSSSDSAAPDTANSADKPEKPKGESKSEMKKGENTSDSKAAEEAVESDDKSDAQEAKEAAADGDEGKPEKPEIQAKPSTTHDKWVAYQKSLDKDEKMDDDEARKEREDGNASTKKRKKGHKCCGWWSIET